MDQNRRRWLGLPFVALGVALIIVDATIVNVAIPSIVEDLGISSTQVQWTQESYTLVFASLLLVFGRLADRFGRRMMFSLGVLGFIIASVIAAQSGSGDALIAARLLQGVGGAMMLPTSLSLLNSNFFGKDRGIAFAVWGSTIGAAAAFGPLLGGWLTTDFSWRWAFGINIPLGLLVLVGTWLFFHETRAEEAKSGADFFGAVSSVLGVGSIVFGLIEGRNYGWWRPIGSDNLFLPADFALSVVPVMFIIGALVLAFFLVVELKRNRQGLPVLLDLNLLAVKSFRNANIAAGIVSLGEFGLLFALPLWLQNVLGYSAFDTGVLLLSLALGSFLASGAGAPLAQKRGPIFVVRTGIVLELIGIAWAGMVVSTTTSWLLIAIPLFFYGSGVGLATAQLTGVALADIPVENSGQASGITSTSRQLGSALGIAILGTTLFTTLGAEFDKSLNDLPAIPQEQHAQLTSALTDSAGIVISQVWPNLPATQPLVEPASEALSTGTRYAAFAGAGFLVIGFLASLRLGKSVPLASKEHNSVAE